MNKSLKIVLFNHIQSLHVHVFIFDLFVSRIIWFSSLHLQVLKRIFIQISKKSGGKSRETNFFSTDKSLWSFDMGGNRIWNIHGEWDETRGVGNKGGRNNGETRCSTPPSAVGTTGTGVGMGIGQDSSTSNSNVLYHPPHHHPQHQHAVGSSAAGMGPTVPQIPNRTPGVLCCPSLRWLTPCSTNSLLVTSASLRFSDQGN